MVGSYSEDRVSKVGTAKRESEVMAIHALSCGGGLLALSQLPGLGGDYKGDLRQISSWSPAIALTLVSEQELLEADAEHLGSDIEGLGTRWLHHPIEDLGTPDAAFRNEWPEISTRLRQALSGGGRVLVHCKGGCGRSGMIVLRLMIETGEPAQDALAHLRRVRPCAVETEAQSRWAMAGRALV